MKLYKYYKNNCAPCYSMERLLTRIGLPEGTELISLNVADEENLKILKEQGINKVPALIREDGTALVGLKTEEELIEFLNQ